jgi:hypothetical protein
MASETSPKQLSSYLLQLVASQLEEVEREYMHTCETHRHTHEYITKTVHKQKRRKVLVYGAIS